MTATWKMPRFKRCAFFVIRGPFCCSCGTFREGPLSPRTRCRAPQCTAKEKPGQAEKLPLAEGEAHENTPCLPFPPAGKGFPRGRALRLRAVAPALGASRGPPGDQVRGGRKGGPGRTGSPLRRDPRLQVPRHREARRPGVAAAHLQLPRFQPQRRLAGADRGLRPGPGGMGGDGVPDREGEDPDGAGRPRRDHQTDATGLPAGDRSRPALPVPEVRAGEERREGDHAEIRQDLHHVGIRQEVPAGAAPFSSGHHRSHPRRDGPEADRI